MCSYTQNQHTCWLKKMNNIIGGKKSVLKVVIICNIFNFWIYSSLDDTKIKLKKKGKKKMKWEAQMCCNIKLRGLGQDKCASPAAQGKQLCDRSIFNLNFGFKSLSTLKTICNQ